MWSGLKLTGPTLSAPLATPPAGPSSTGSKIAVGLGEARRVGEARDQCVRARERTYVAEVGRTVGRRCGRASLAGIGTTRDLEGHVHARLRHAIHTHKRRRAGCAAHRLGLSAR